MRPTAQGFDEYLGFYPGASLYLDADDPRAVNSVQEFDPIDVFLWANLAFAVRKDGGERFRPPEYMTDYLGNQAVKAIDGQPQPPLLPLLRAQRAAHAAAGAAVGLRRPAADQGPPAARLRRDDPRSGSRTSAASSMR